jgi:hypothetical protein
LRPEDHFYGEMIRSVGQPPAHATIEFPLRGKIQVQRRKNLMLRIAELETEAGVVLGHGCSPQRPLQTH